MKILSIQLTNFASYKSLKFTFDKQGLTLIQGPTGAGKSTLMDAIPWVLFGRTAKNGTVDEVLSWPGIDTTHGIVMFDNGQTIERFRGPKAGSNDLFMFKDGAITRGKDLPDTQKLINNLLGFDADTYLAGAYFHEFSPTAAFFATNAKNRRQLTEQLADLSLAKTLTQATAEYRKEVKLEHEKLSAEMTKASESITYIHRLRSNEGNKEHGWDIHHKDDIRRQTVLRDRFKSEKDKKYAEIKEKFKINSEALQQTIDTVGSTIVNQEILLTQQHKYDAALSACKDIECDKCGSKLDASERNQIHLGINRLILQKAENDQNIRTLARLKADRHRLDVQLKEQLDELKSQRNIHIDNLEYLENKVNPHTETVKMLSDEAAVQYDKVVQLKLDIDSFAVELADLELLQQVTNSFRMLLIQNTINELETATNTILTDYFDGELRVAFSVEDSDKLDVTITKNGNTCSYTQLSKGQRQLLKLSFAVSVMSRISDHHGIDFGSIFLDESLDGFDDTLKVKAYGLLQSLSLKHDSVFVVEHNSDLKQMFTNTISVKLIDGYSHFE